MPVNETEASATDRTPTGGGPGAGRLARWLQASWLGGSASGSAIPNASPRTDPTVSAPGSASAPPEENRVPEPNAPMEEGDSAPRSVPELPLNRDGEATKLWFRTDRVFHQNGGWYISTREGIDVGPYEQAELARRDATRLIELLLQSSVHGSQAQMLTIQQFMHRPRFRNRR